MPVMQEELIANLEKVYKIHVQKCIHGPRQVVAETYIVDDSTDRQYFCKIIDNSLLIPDIIQSLPVLMQMYQNGIDKIACPIASSKGLYFYIGSSLVVVYDFVPVEQGLNYNLFTLGSMVAKVHEVTSKITAVTPRNCLNFQIKGFLMNAFKASFVATMANNIIGFCDVGPARLEKSVNDLNSSYGEIYAIYVLKPYQNTGIGKSLYEKAVEYLQKNWF